MCMQLTKWYMQAAARCGMQAESALFCCRGACSHQRALRFLDALLPPLALGPPPAAPAKGVPGMADLGLALVPDRLLGAGGT